MNNRDTKLDAKGLVSCATDAKAPQSLNLHISQLAFGVRLASVVIMENCRWWFSAFKNHVAYVIKLRADEQMVWSYTDRIVATVAHLKPFWNWSKVQYPRSSMGFDAAPFGASPVNPAVFESWFRTVSASRPKPTIFGFVNLGPKAFWEVLRKTLRAKVLKRNLNHSYSVCPLALQMRRAF